MEVGEDFSRIPGPKVQGAGDRVAKKVERITGRGQSKRGHKSL